MLIGGRGGGGEERELAGLESGSGSGSGLELVANWSSSDS